MTLQELQEMNAAEQALKRSYIESPERHLDHPCAQDEVLDIIIPAFSRLDRAITESLAEQVSEQIFIADDMDAALVKHARYTPAFWHQHDFFELTFVLQGHCINNIIGNTFTMRKGDLCIMAPNVTHAIGAFTDNDIIMNILIRRSTFEQSFLGILEGNNILADFFKRIFYQTSEIPYLLFHAGDDEVLFCQIYNACDEFLLNRRFKRHMLNTMLSTFFITLFRRHEQHIEVPSIHLNTENENLIYILQYMHANYTTVSLGELAALFNYSSRQMQRIIYAATGHTFIENIQGQKMTHAAALLSGSTRPISEISEQVGFPSENNFRKTFYRYYQMTPSEYRRSCK